MTTLILPKRQWLVFVLLILVGQSAWTRHCVDSNVFEAGTGLNQRQAYRMLTDASFDGNKKVSRKEKVRRVYTSIGHSHNGLPKISRAKLATLIVDMSTCTGNDFTVFAGLLKKESDYCLNVLNNTSEKSTASGCGQITVWPIREIKNHFGLPGRTKAGDANSRYAITRLLNNCFKEDEARIQDFIELLSQPSNDVKAYLRSGDDYELDLFMAAFYLKFHYGRVGYYYNPHTSGPGALSLYGEGSGYAGLVTSYAGNVDMLCFDDDDYLKPIEKESCQLTSDAEACFQTTPTHEL